MCRRQSGRRHAGAECGREVTNGEPPSARPNRERPPALGANAHYHVLTRSLSVVSLVLAGDGSVAGGACPSVLVARGGADEGGAARSAQKRARWLHSRRARIARLSRDRPLPTREPSGRRGEEEEHNHPRPHHPTHAADMMMNASRQIGRVAARQTATAGQTHSHRRRMPRRTVGERSFLRAPVAAMHARQPHGQILAGAHNSRV